MYNECINTINTLHTDGENSKNVQSVSEERRKRMILLDYHDRRPIYEQVTDKFRMLILNGVLQAG